MKISCVLITYNEAQQIVPCLESLDGIADEIVVVDSGSKDNTVQLCQKYGARVFFAPFDGFGKMKNLAIEKASHEWILSIDADERLSPELRKQLLQIKDEGSNLSGYYIRRQNIAFGMVIKHWWEYQLRLFRKTKGCFIKRKVHEHAVVSGPTQYIHAPIIHFTYDTVSEQVAKINRYTDLAAEEWKRGKIRVVDLYVKPAYITMLLLFRRGLILDGIAGVHIAVMQGLHEYLKYFKAWVNLREPDCIQWIANRQVKHRGGQ